MTTLSDIQARPRPTKHELFFSFTWLGMISFGGVLPLAHRLVVERKHWLTEPEFAEMLALCQFLPGGSIINMSVALGMKFRGPAGAVAAMMGLICVPTLIVVLLGMVYDSFRDDPQIARVFAGLAAAASGLMIAMGIKMAKTLRGDIPGLLVVLASFVTIALLRVPLLYGMAALSLVSIAIVMWRRRS